MDRRVIMRLNLMAWEAPLGEPARPRGDLGPIIAQAKLLAEFLLLVVGGGPDNILALDDHHRLIVPVRFVRLGLDGRCCRWG